MKNKREKDLLKLCTTVHLQWDHLLRTSNVLANLTKDFLTVLLEVCHITRIALIAPETGDQEWCIVYF